MNITTKLVMGPCLLLQGLLVQSSHRVPVQRMTAAVTPLFHHAQARELLGLDSNSDQATKNLFNDDVVDRSAELAIYIGRRTRELLPKSYREHSPSISKSLIQIAGNYKMDPLFLMAIIKHESGYNPEAIGSHGEVGLMQIKPSTALWLIEEDLIAFTSGEPSYEVLSEALLDPETNIAFGAAYLALLRTTFKGRGSHYVSAYNMGAVNLKTHIRNGETPRIYSDRIVALYTDFSLDFHHSAPVTRRSVASLPGDLAMNFARTSTRTLDWF